MIKTAEILTKNLKKYRINLIQWHLFSLQCLKENQIRNKLEETEKIPFEMLAMKIRSTQNTTTATAKKDSSPAARQEKAVYKVL